MLPALQDDLKKIEVEMCGDDTSGWLWLAPAFNSIAFCPKLEWERDWGVGTRAFSI